MIRLILSVPAWWLLARYLMHRTNLGATAVDLIAALVVLVLWPVFMGVAQMFGFLRPREPRSAIEGAQGSSGGAVQTHQVGLGPTSFSTGFWGWLIARQLARRR